MKHNSKLLRLYKMRIQPKLLFTITGIFLFAIGLQAQWSTNTAVNNAICTATGQQNNPVITSDGAGGAIIAWSDVRGTDENIYAQRIDVNGVVQWTTNGVVICNASGGQNAPKIVSDGAGGAIITWMDLRGVNYDVYAQRVDASGSVLWTTNGVAICTAANSKALAVITTDDAGGAIITWRDRRNGPPKGPLDIYAQRVDASGAIQWTVNGEPICTQAASQDNPTIAPDGQNGAIIAWDDMRNASGGNDIYAQHVSGTGTMLWTVDGIPVCTNSGNQTWAQALADGAGGAIIAWHDERSGNTDIYAQQVDGSGTTGWTANGISVCSATQAQAWPRLISDNAGGAILTWHDNRTDPDGDIYAQHISSAGMASWTTNGVAICTESSEQRLPSITASGAGAIIAWYDGRNGYTDIYGQRINSSGAGQWTTDGIAISSATREQWNTEIISSPCGGAIVTWPDNRDVLTGDDGQVYAQRVNADGTIGAYVALNLSFTLTHIECGEPNSGAIDLTVSGGTAPYTFSWTGSGVNPTSEDQSGLAPGIYTVLVTDAVGCTTEAEVEILDCEQRLAGKSAILTEVKGDIGVSVQPNPASHYFNLRVKSNDFVNAMNIRIFNTNGKIIMEFRRVTAGSMLMINSEKWTAGVYYAEVIQGGKREVIKMVKVN